MIAKAGLFFAAALRQPIDPNCELIRNRANDQIDKGHRFGLGLRKQERSIRYEIGARQHAELGRLKCHPERLSWVR